jgi:hypothetical protein
MTGPSMHRLAYRAYFRRMITAAVLYLAAIVAAVSLLHDRTQVSFLAVAIALLPGLAVVLMIAAIARLMLEMNDEFQRLLIVRQALVATAITLAITSVWGMLEIFTNVPRLELFWVFPMWCMGLAIGALFNKFTLGAGGCA